MNIIEINHLVKYYKDHLVINNITYVFKQKLTYLIVGANGSGKSTLIKIMLSFVKPSSGNINLLENSIGYVPEKAIFPEMISIKEFLINLALIRKLDLTIASKAIDHILSEWSLDGRKRMDKLSKGMTQKVLLIQALLHNPHLLIFDEPLNGLDADSQKQFFKQIKLLQLQNKSIIIVTHYRDYYQNLADKIIHISNGAFDEESI